MVRDDGLGSDTRCLYIDGDYVLLTPKDILTKDDAWINKHDIIGDFDDILESMQNSELRAQVNEYLLRRIPENPKQKEVNEATKHAPQIS